MAAEEKAAAWLQTRSESDSVDVVLAVCTLFPGSTLAYDPGHLTCCDGATQVRSGGGQQSPYYEQLIAAQEAAETQKLGVWTQASASSPPSEYSMPE